MKNSLLTIVCLALCGCTAPRTYTQPGAVPGGISSEITSPNVITNSILDRLDIRVLIESVDGKSTATFWGFLTDSMPYAEAACVKPGRHYLGLRYDPRGLGGFQSHVLGRVWFDAEAGKNYFVRGGVVGDVVEFWMEDGETGRVVGGLAGGETPLDGNTNQPPAAH